MLNFKQIKGNLEEENYRLSNDSVKISQYNSVWSNTIFDHLYYKYVEDPLKRGTLGALAKMAGMEV